MSVSQIWNRLFLQKRPSVSLAFFRIAVAMAVGLHVIPSMFYLQDNYLSTALKELNYHFFTPAFLDLVAKSPEGVVYFFVGFFFLSWFFFLVGLFAQASCIVMTLC